jgi:hypothetical protein
MLGKTTGVQRKHVEGELVEILGFISYFIAFTSSIHPMPPQSPPNPHITFQSKSISPLNSPHLSQNEQVPNTYMVQSQNEVLDANQAMQLSVVS